MNTTIDELHGSAGGAANNIASSPAHQAFRILHFGFTVAPILAGLDKFFHLLVNWDQYLPDSRRVGQVLPPPGQLGPVSAWGGGNNFTRTSAYIDACGWCDRDCRWNWGRAETADLRLHRRRLARVNHSKPVANSRLL